RVRQAGRRDAAHGRGNVGDRLVEADARVFPVEQSRDVIADRGVGGASRHQPEIVLPLRVARVVALICRSNPFGVLVRSLFEFAVWVSPRPPVSTRAVRPRFSSSFCTSSGSNGEMPKAMCPMPARRTAGALLAAAPRLPR